MIKKEGVPNYLEKGRREREREDLSEQQDLDWEMR